MSYVKIVEFPSPSGEEVTLSTRKYKSLINYLHSQNRFAKDMDTFVVSPDELKIIVQEAEKYNVPRIKILMRKFDSEGRETTENWKGVLKDPKSSIGVTYIKATNNYFLLQLEENATFDPKIISKSKKNRDLNILMHKERGGWPVKYTEYPDQEQHLPDILHDELLSDESLTSSGNHDGGSSLSERDWLKIFNSSTKKKK